MTRNSRFLVAMLLGMTKRGSTFVFAALLAMTIVACGSDRGTGPVASGPAILRITSGGSGTDTILSTLPQLLTVQVTDSAGHPFVGVVVRFDPAEIVDANGLTSSATMVYAAPPDTGQRTVELALRTDGQGRAQARVILGNKAGTGAMLITVPDAGVQDTARYVIKPGKPYRVRTTIADTAVLTGATFSMPVKVTDVYDNSITDPPTFTVGPALVRVDANGTVTAGDQPGRGWVEARINGLADTMLVSVVPHWTVAASVQTSDGFWSIVTSALDGTNQRVVYRSGEATQWPRWSPAGDAILYTENTDLGARRLYVVTLDGARRRLIASPPSTLHSEWLGSYSHDGQWIYFTSDSPDPLGWSGITGWRVHADGTGAEQLLRPDQSVEGVYPGPSPDGTHYIATRDGTLFIVDLATSAWDSLGVYGEEGQYSPAGDRIAFVQIRPGLAGPLFVMNADGSALRQITSDARPYGQYEFGWSPDGQFLIARGPDNLELIRVSDGLILPLPFSRPMLQPALKP